MKTYYDDNIQKRKHITDDHKALTWYQVVIFFAVLIGCVILGYLNS